MVKLFLTLLILSTTWAQARSYLRIVGSSTGYPFVAAAAEHFGRKTSYKTPVVENTGTGGGLKLFASGYKDNHPDVVIASRKMRPQELSFAYDHGIRTLQEIILGLDGIVLAQNQCQPSLCLTPKDLYLGIAKYVLVGNKLIKNPYKTWNEVDPTLPHRPIMIYGPPATSGTRAIFIHKVFKPLFSDPAYAHRNLHDLTLFRTDGPYVELGENMNLMIQKLAINPDGIAMIGYNYYIQNRPQIQSIAINGITPTTATIASRNYPLTRNFYLYAKTTPDRQGMLDAFLKEIKSADAIGQGGYLESKGLVASPLQLRDKRQIILEQGQRE